jgi:CRISPR-associated endonuclease Csn1
MGSYTLGLDLGSNSIGWALLDEAGTRVIDAGVRVFPEGVDAFDTAKEKSRTQERRIKRGMRRQIVRRARRKAALRKLLMSHGLLPTDQSALHQLLQQDPYQLRAQGLDRPLTLHEFGRVLLHLNARRGFLSNSKSDKGTKEKEKENSDMLKEISALAKEIADAGHRTLGEHFASRVAKSGETPKVRVRGRHTRREMLRTEFAMLWATQKPHHPEVLTDNLKKMLDDPAGDETWWMGGAIFGQRNLKPSNLVGRCEFEPKERRCPSAERIAQRYRLLSEVNNLKYIDPDNGKVQPLDKAQRTLLLDHLSKKKDMTFDAVRKLLGMLDTVQFNLEKGDRARLKGHVVDYVMAKESPFGSKWWEMTEAQKNEIVRLRADPRTRDPVFLRTATTEWGLTPEQAQQLLGVALPRGYSSLSRKAIGRLVPHMEQGLLLMTVDGTPSALVNAGYLRPDQRPRKLLEQLPEPPDLPNPVVRQALHELRRVVNAIIRAYGKPSRIHVELARNIKMGPDARDKYNKSRQEREDRRAAAAEAIRAEAPRTRLSRDLIDKYLLWNDQGGECVYSGKSISLRHLLAGEVDVDHIFPRWRSLDDSFANKVVCFRDMNNEKGDQTPFEWLSGDPKRYEAVKQRVRKLPWRKRARFTQETLDTSEFSARQLVDTAYITRAAVDYLRCLVAEPHHVLGGKGTYTAELRHLWGLETVLSEFPDSPAWAAQADLRPGEKNRADHRHHTLDAIVVALTDQKRLQALSKLYKNGESGAEIEPWEGFRDSAKAALAKINVSHRVQRKVGGALHDETIYGRTSKPDEFVVRKPLESLTPSMVEDIRDETIRAAVLKRLDERGVKHGRKAAGTIKKEIWQPPLTMASGVPIRRVRVVVKMGAGSIREVGRGPNRRLVATGSNHHIEIRREQDVKKKSGQRGVIVSSIDAAQRVRLREPLVDRKCAPNEEFVMSLSINEMILISDDSGIERLFRVQKMDVNGSVILRPHTYAGRCKDTDKPPMILRRSGSTITGRKVTVDPLGRIRWAND